MYAVGEMMEGLNESERGNVPEELYEAILDDDEEA
jgi:hypothetical protein